MVYASYEYYTSEYGGSAVTDEEWQRLSKAASAEIDHVTFGRLKKLPDDQIIDAVRDATCAVAEQLHRRSVSEDRDISSENNDGYSVSYQALVARSDFQRELWRTIRTYLGHTGLMFRGGNQYGKCHP